MTESIITSTTCDYSGRTSSQASADTELWYVALRKLHIPNSPGATPSSLRIIKGQRFQLDGDEAVNIEELIRLGAANIYEESDSEWAQVEMAEARKPRRRRRSSGTDNS